MPDNQGLIAHLAKYGKLKTQDWDYLANAFEFETGEKARKVWSWYKKKHGIETIKQDRAEYVTNLENKVTEFSVEGNKAEIKGQFTDEIKTLEELISKCNIDTTIWKIDRYIQNYWGNSKTPHWQVKAWLSKITEKEVFQQSFQDFLSTYQSGYIPVSYSPTNLPSSCLVINKQDEHINKFDINGDNSMEIRALRSLSRIKSIVEEARTTHELSKIVYIVGSDQFNSEWTKATVKGTPQENVCSYQDSFQLACDYEANTIIGLLLSAKYVDVVYVSGNHDEYVGWHLIHWLSAYFADEKRVTFDISPKYRKYSRYGNSAIMFNHGDVMKPEQLAAVFPQEFRSGWSDCSFQYIFTGDKHTELSKDMNGIQLYQLSALSTATSQWDDKRGYSNSKRELTAFLIDASNGLTNIYKRPI